MNEVTSRAKDLDVAKRDNLQHELTRAIQADAASVPTTEAALRTGTLHPQAETVAIAALVGARTPEAQRAVGSLVKDPQLDETLRVRVLQSAALMTQPTAEFVTTLSSLVVLTDDAAYRSAVATTLGAAIGYLKETQPTEAATAMER